MIVTILDLCPQEACKIYFFSFLFPFICSFSIIFLFREQVRILGSKSLVSNINISKGIPLNTYIYFNLFLTTSLRVFFLCFLFEFS